MSVQPAAPDPVPIIHKEETAKGAGKGKHDLQNIPKDIQIHIMKFFGVKDLGNNILITKLWTVLAADPKRWIELAKNLKINITNPKNAREEVLQHFDVLKQVNEKLLTMPSIPPNIRNIKNSVEANRAIRKYIRELNEKVCRAEMWPIINTAMKEMHLVGLGESNDRVSIPLLQMLCEEGVDLVKSLADWSGDHSNDIYFLGHLGTYEKFLSKKYPRGMSLKDCKMELIRSLTCGGPVDYTKVILQRGVPNDLLIKVWLSFIGADRKFDQPNVDVFVENLRRMNPKELSEHLMRAKQEILATDSGKSDSKAVSERLDKGIEEIQSLVQAAIKKNEE